MSKRPTPPAQHWGSAAARWALYGPPLRPASADLDVLLDYIARYANAPTTRAPRALVLGVTPEIVTMSWPSATHVTGIDRASEMVHHIWPGDVTGQREALCADWLTLSPPREKFDYVVGDGSLNTLEPVQELVRLFEVLHGQATRGALLLTRSFTRTTTRETVAAIVAAARAGTIESFHSFKFRLAMALQNDYHAGIQLGEVWRCWDGLDFDPRPLAHKPHWSADIVRTIELYRDAPTRLYFPTPTELAAVLTAAGLELLASHQQPYEMGDRCTLTAARF